MTFTQTQLDALNSAIAEGVLEVEYDGKKVRYRSVSEMLQVRNLIRQSLGIAGAKPARKIGVLDKGL